MSNLGPFGLLAGMTGTEQLYHATRFSFGGGKQQNQRRCREDYPVDVEAVEQLDGTVLWAVRHLGACIASDGHWQTEQQPSSRDKQLLERCRFSKERAFELALSVVRKEYQSGRGESQ